MKNPIASAFFSFGIAVLVLWRTYVQYTALGVAEQTGIGDGNLGRISRAIYQIGGKHAVLGTGILVAMILVGTGVQYLRARDK